MAYSFYMSDPFLEWLQEVKQNVRVYPYAFEPNTAHKDTLTVPDVARELKTSEDTIRGWINSGQLRASDIGTQRPRYVILRDDLNTFLKSRQR